MVLAVQSSICHETIICMEVIFESLIFTVIFVSEKCFWMWKSIENAQIDWIDVIDQCKMENQNLSG